MYYTVIKQTRHLRTLEKCRKLSPATHVFYISLVFSNARCVLSQCNTQLRLLYLLMRQHMAIKLMCKLLYVLEINLFAMLSLVMYMFVSVNLKLSHPLPLPTGDGVLPEKLGGATSENPYHI